MKACHQVLEDDRARLRVQLEALQKMLAPTTCGTLDAPMDLGMAALRCLLLMPCC